MACANCKCKGCNPVFDDLGHALGHVLRQERMEQGLSQPQVGAKAAIHPSNLSNLERGKGGSPTLRTLDRVATALGLTLRELFVRGQALMKVQS